MFFPFKGKKNTHSLTMIIKIFNFVITFQKLTCNVIIDFCIYQGNVFYVIAH